MPSKKKSRGRERKARSAAVRRQVDLRTRHARYHDETFRGLPPSAVVEGVRRGEDLPTQAVVQLSGTDRADIELRQRLVDEGLVEAVLALLRRCADEDFLGVLEDVGPGGEEGLALPSVWVNLLLNTVAHDNLPSPKRMDECRLLIAKSIGPLVKCMVDDIKREFFRDNMHWHNSILLFVVLLRNLVLTKETVPFLLKYDGLADMLIQSMFWEELRPDILAESERYGTFVMPDTFPSIVDSAGHVVQELVDVGDENGGFREREVKRLDFLARTPIVSKEYSPDGGTTFAVGLARALSSKTSSIDKEHIFWIVDKFAASGCVDRHVIEGILEHGSKTNAHEDAQPILAIVYNMVMKSKPDAIPIPNDSLFGAVIAAGLLEMCVRFVWRFGSRLDAGVLGLMSLLLHGASAVALLKKPSEAISVRRSAVLALLRDFSEAEIDEDCQEVLGIIRSIVQTGDGSGEYRKAFCRKCSKVLSEDAARRCAKCKRAIYCSRSCQKEDWHDGHKQDCKHMATQGVQVKTAGRGKRDVKKAEQHEKNVSLAGAKVFSENIHLILLQAIDEHQRPITDCVVCIDLTQAPPSIEVKPAAEFLSNYCRKNDEYGAEEFAHTKRIIDRNRSDGSITCACISLGVYAEETDAAGNPATAVLLKTFPAVSAPGGSWVAYQKHMERSLP